MEYGYARVSTKEQNEQRQIIALEEFGLNLRQIFMVLLTFLTEELGTKKLLPLLLLSENR